MQGAFLSRGNGFLKHFGCVGSQRWIRRDLLRVKMRQHKVNKRTRVDGADHWNAAASFAERHVRSSMDCRLS